VSEPDVTPSGVRVLDTTPPEHCGILGSSEDFQKLISGHRTADLSRVRIEMGDQNRRRRPKPPASPITPRTV
jgi:hypothetical protein